MQHPIELRGVITEIAFKLDMQFGEHSSLLAETTTFFVTIKYYFSYVHTPLHSYLQSCNKITLMFSTIIK